MPAEDAMNVHVLIKETLNQYLQSLEKLDLPVEEVALSKAEMQHFLMWLQQYSGADVLVALTDAKTRDLTLANYTAFLTVNEQKTPQQVAHATKTLTDYFQVAGDYEG